MMQFERFVSVIGLPLMVYLLPSPNVIERKKLFVRSFVLTISPVGKPPGKTRSLPFAGTPGGDQLAGADQLPEGSAPVHVFVAGAATGSTVTLPAMLNSSACGMQ